MSDERTRRYAEAIWPSLANYDYMVHAEVLSAERVIAVADAEQAELRAAMRALADKWESDGITCGCGHDIGSEHNSNGCYAVVTYEPYVRCSCGLTCDQSEGEIAAAQIRALLEVAE